MVDTRTAEDYARLEWDKDGKRLADDPAAMLDLPEGLLILEGLPVALHGAASYPVLPEKVQEAATYILAHRTPEQAEKIFHNQAEVLSYASQEFGWHTGKELGFVAIANHMGIAKPPLEERRSIAAMIDTQIEVLKEGLLTTREGAKKLFPDMDVDDIFDRHEAKMAEAKARQQEQAKEILEKMKQEKSAISEVEDAASPPTEAKQTQQCWTDKVEAQRRQRPNPCLGL